MPDASAEPTGAATYCPEDDKLRLYIGRVPREEYLKLKAQGWKALHKQREAGGGDFVATWTPSRHATALRYSGGVIEDEDMSPQERAADRAERFAGYRQKRLGEAVGHADRFDAGPSVHGFQDYGRAVKAADRHDRIAGRAVDAWGKADYWQRRTAGVIGHALYKLSPSVRMGRIKDIEKDLRKHEAEVAAAVERFEAWTAIAAMTDPEQQTIAAKATARGGSDWWAKYKHPRPESASQWNKEHGSSLYDLLTQAVDPITGAEAAALYLSEHSRPEADNDWSTHYKLRLAYENQMIEAQGGRAADVEMIPGGWLISGQPGWRRFRDGDEARRIIKVNKSPATGRVVTVLVRDNHPSSRNQCGNDWPDGIAKVLCHTVNVERAGPECYRPPTPEELAEFQASEKAAKKARKASAPAPVPLVNPTDEDAERLQASLNEQARADHCARHLKAYGRDYADEFKPSTVCRIPQKVYSEASKGSYSRAETRALFGGMQLAERQSNLWTRAAEERSKARGPEICEIRTTGSDGSDYGARRVIVLTDKPRKPLPAAVWEAYAPKTAELVTA
jgi:hypothetical protein